MAHKLDFCIVRIFDVSGEPAGTGFAISDRLVATCAHVVKQALGLNEYPVEIPKILLDVDFPLVVPGQLFKAFLYLWQPPKSDGSGDVAILEIKGDIPDQIEPAKIMWGADLWGQSFRAFGFPEGYKNGVWASGRILAREATGWYQIEDVKTTGFFIQRGFSGAPVWSEKLDAVVGMVIAVETIVGVKVAFILPINTIIETFPSLREKVTSVSPLSYRPPRGFSKTFAKYPNLSLLVQWVLASTIGWDVGVVNGLLQVPLCVCGFPIIALVLWLILRRSIYQAGKWALLSTSLIFLIAVLGGNFRGGLAWATLGLTIGGTQWLVLRRVIPKTDWWIFSTAIGWVVGWALYKIAGGQGEIAIITFGGGVGASILQWYILRRHFSKAFLWILASAVCWLITVLFINLISGPSQEMMSALEAENIRSYEQLREILFPVAYMILIVIGGVGILLGFITGAVLVLLPKRRSSIFGEKANVVLE